jgi:Fe-S-cluster containining protein
MADKIFECCGRNPETGAAVAFLMDDNRTVRACPSLDHEGRCRIYEHRPAGCRMHSCQTVFHQSFFRGRWGLKELLNPDRGEM